MEGRIAPHLVLPATRALRCTPERGSRPGRGCNGRMTWNEGAVGPGSVVERISGDNVARLQRCDGGGVRLRTIALMNPRPYRPTRRNVSRTESSLTSIALRSAARPSWLSVVGRAGR